MAKPRQTSSGKWELALRHRMLPKGRKYATFDTEPEAIEFARKWKALSDAGLPPPAELLVAPKAPQTLMSVLRDWMATGRQSTTDDALCSVMMSEVGGVAIKDVTYQWAERWVEHLKLEQNLAPSTIRQRVGALSRAMDHFCRGVGGANPLRLLPRGYSGYTATDARKAVALGKKVKVDVSRDRRLAPHELVAIRAVLGAGQRDGGEHEQHGGVGAAMACMFELILHTGLRLQEAYSLRVKSIDCKRRTIRVQSSKQWRGAVRFRNVPIRSELLATIEPYLRNLDPEGLAFPLWEPGEKLASVSNRISKQFARCFARAGIEGLTEHDLRHEAACQWYELTRKGSVEYGHWVFREVEIEKIMGWAPGSKMGSRYASFRAEDLASRLA